MPFPIEFVKCPICGCKDTVCRLACADEPSIPKDTFVSLEKVFSPLQLPTQMLSSVAKGILCHYDVCAKCGHHYCTKAEKLSLPVTVQQTSVNTPQFDPRSHRRIG